uniref:Uncharacterized protein n=1 Tax=Ditylenchus dipsaci TaxID=166011 RepID=A0A915CP67_9BILA
MPQRWQTETGLYMDTARLLLSLLHAWNMDENLDPICLKNLKLLKPKVPICYGTISRKGHISLWQQNRALTTVHLLSVIALSNTLMSFRSRHLHLTAKRPVLRRVSSTKSTDSTADNESQQIKQGWSNVAALHCVLLPDLVKPSTSYAAPRIDLLARRWQDNCIEIRDASQALLIREFERLGPQGKCSKAIAFVIFVYGFKRHA